MKRIWLAILLLVWLGLAAQSTGFNFEGEKLDFHLRPDAKTGELIWELDGVYWFSNLSEEPLSQVIAFPVPSDSLCSEAQDLSLKIGSYGDSTYVNLLNQWPQGFSFRLEAPQRRLVAVQISYHQRLQGKTARYVLMTTNSWGRALPLSEISLRVDKSLRVKNISLSDYQLESLEGDALFTWSLSDFVAATDLIVELE